MTTIPRQSVSSAAPWESHFAYSRAVRMGPFIAVAGTTAADESGKVVGHGDAYTQARYVLRKIERALHEVGAGLEHVVRTRMYVTNMDDWRRVGEAHGEVFRSIKPAATIVEVGRLIVPEALVEIEVEAYVPS